MIESNKSTFYALLRTLERCVVLLIDLCARRISLEHKGMFDYDPINNEDFLERLFSLINDASVNVIYIDVENILIQKKLIFERDQMALPRNLTELRGRHAELHDCSVEGSYFVVGESGSWIVFYDAQSGAGVILSGESRVMIGLSEYIVQ